MARSFWESRLPLRTGLQRAVRKLFPSHWSFLLGEVALFSFVVLIVTGVYLALFYRASSVPSVYAGSYAPMRGRPLPEAFVSVMTLSLDVPFGLVVRRMHHWAAHLFIASLLLHAARVFFTGAFRRPRELTWWLGLAMFAQALVSGFTGYAIPFDLRGGASIRMALTTLQSIPWVGGWLSVLAFGEEFPGSLILGRLYLVHVLLGPALIALILLGHLYLVVRFTHTDYPGPRRSESLEVGGPAWPDQAARSTTLMLLVGAFVAGLSAFLPVEAIWHYGPFQPYAFYEPLQPDWFLLWIEGAYRLLPPQLNFHLIGANFTGPFYGAVLLPTIVLGGCAIYPYLEQRMSGAIQRDHHILEDFRVTPFRTAFGSAGLSFLVLLSFGAINDRMATAWHMSVSEVNVLWRTVTLGVPPVLFLALYVAGRSIRARRVGARPRRQPFDWLLSLATSGVALVAAILILRDRIRRRIGKNRLG